MERHPVLYFSKPVVRLFLSLEAHPRDRLASLALNRPTFGSRPENRPLYFYLSLEVVSKAFTDFFLYTAHRFGSQSSQRLELYEKYRLTFGFRPGNRPVYF